MPALNSLITIESQATSQDALGQPSGSWSTLVQVWANIRHLNGAEMIRSGVEASTVRSSIRVRKRSDITAKHRAVHGSTIYDIEAVLPDEEDRMFMYLVCKVKT